jgi:hypothetical protein
MDRISTEIERKNRPFWQYPDPPHIGNVNNFVFWWKDLDCNPLGPKMILDGLEIVPGDRLIKPSLASLVRGLSSGVLDGH